HARYAQALPQAVSMSDLFEHVTVRRLAQHLGSSSSAPVTREQGVDAVDASEQPMAIIGMTVNVAGAQNLAEFWTMIQGNQVGIEQFAAVEGQVGARSQLAG
ncbi:hypothetical protein, partial [Pseudomonas viridiflava]